MKILDTCRQIIDTESGRVLLYRDEVEAVLTAETQKRKQRKGRDARGAFVTGGWHLEVTGAEFGNDGALNRVDIEGMDYKSSWFHQELVKIESQPEVLTAGDTISRRQAIDALGDEPEVWTGKDEYAQGLNNQWHYDVNALKTMPSAQPERTCVNCGRTVNNGGWYADGGTRCPIEEHYALPKDGYCHLWEKRNVTDDDYPERQEE